MENLDVFAEPCFKTCGFFHEKWFNTSFYRKQLNRSLKVDACTTFT